MKEMVSLRGVAKKRRKQEPGGTVNQMFAYCCGHATIVARRQPLFGFIEAVPAARFDRSPFPAPAPRAGHNLRAIETEVSPTRDWLHVIMRPNLILRHKRRRESQVTIRNRDPHSER